MTDPLHAQALAAGHASVAEWVAAKDALIAARDTMIMQLGENTALACASYMQKIAAKDAEIAELREALDELIPHNIGVGDHLPSGMTIPVDMTMGEIRRARAALTGDA